MNVRTCAWSRDLHHNWIECDVDHISGWAKKKALISQRLIGVQ